MTFEAFQLFQRFQHTLDLCWSFLVGLVQFHHKCGVDQDLGCFDDFEPFHMLHFCSCAEQVCRLRSVELLSQMLVRPSWSVDFLEK